MKVALVYDRVNKWGGAERLIIALKKIFPDAPLFTSLYNSETAVWAKNFKIKTSFLQRIPTVWAQHERLALFMPIAFESFSFDEYDLVISITSEAAKGIITKPSTFHLCICLTPTRYLWSNYDDYFKNKILSIISYPFVCYLRFWDKIAAARPDYLVAISENVQRRIKKYYNRDSFVIYPPAGNFMEKNTQKFLKSKNRRGDYFLIVSRLVHYKRIDLAIEACDRLSLKLKIVGIGKESSFLKRIAGKTVEFLGQVSDNKLSFYYNHAKALIFPGVEDFGLTMVEAQLFGLPVIAADAGGAKEIIKKHITGEFFKAGDLDSLICVLKRFNIKKYNSTVCRENAKRFSLENFENKIKQNLAAAGFSDFV